MACKCGCGGDSMDFQTVLVVQEVRDNFGAAVTISSAYRCLEYNRSIGSSDESKHPLARAIDFTVAGVDAADVQAYLHLRYPGIYGVGSYETFTHFDSRGGDGARWHG